MNHELGNAKVLDAWAMMAWLRGQQPAAAEVQVLLEEAAEGRVDLSMSVLSAGEVYYTLARREGRDRAARFFEDLPTMPLRLAPPSGALVRMRLRRPFGRRRRW